MPHIVYDTAGIANRIYSVASHTHCGVSMDEPDQSVLEYVEKLYGLLAQAAVEAVADLAPATTMAKYFIRYIPFIPLPLIPITFIIPICL